MPPCCINQHRNPLGRVWCAECPSLVAGAVIGEYVIVSHLGQGTTSAVYLANQPKLNNRKVVIKVLHAVASQESAEDFRKEAALLASLSHPYILPIYAYDLVEEVRVDQQGNYIYSPYLVLRYSEQGSLDEVFKREGNRPWSLQRVLPIMEEAAEALDYAHSRGILHRDVKPANLLLFGSHTMLADFGVASLIDVDISHLDAPWAGSPAYMAPEVWRFRPGRYSDQYALAVTCYRLLTGEYPWKLTTGGASKWMNLHQHVAPQPLRSYRPDLPVGVGLVLLRALAKEPHDRYPSVGAFASALRSAAREEIQQPLPSQPTLPSRPSGEIVTPGPSAKPAPAPVKEPVPRLEARPSPPDRATPPVRPSLAGTSQNGKGSLDWEISVTGSLAQEISQKLHRDRWTLQAFVLNLVICVGLVAAAIFFQYGISTALRLALSLWPALLVGPIIGRLFRRVTLSSSSWGVLLGMIFGIGNAFLSALVCFGWTVLFNTWNSLPSQGVSALPPEVMSLLQLSTLLLFLVGLWASVCGGALIGLFAARAATARP